MRDKVEQHQSWLYLIFIMMGLAVGIEVPGFAEPLEQWLWPLLGTLIYATFTQIPLLHIARSFADKRFMTALIVGNFIAIPVFLALVVLWLPLSPAVLAGVLLVLLVPCTDWFITFTHLGKGDTAQAMAATPLLLLVQMVTLPVYLWLFLGSEWLKLTFSAELFSAFTGLILVPLVLAGITEYAALNVKTGNRIVHKLGLLPVPLLALVVFIIAATQVNTVLGLSQILVQVVFIFIGFLLFAALLGKGLGKLFKLSPASARTLTFSFGTRNSFMILPIALTLPSTWQAAVAVIVFQSLVELFGMVVFLRWVPSKLLPEQEVS